MAVIDALSDFTFLLLHILFELEFFWLNLHDFELEAVLLSAAAVANQAGISSRRHSIHEVGRITGVYFGLPARNLNQVDQDATVLVLR